MKERKIIIIAVVLAIVISCALITIFILFTRINDINGPGGITTSESTTQEQENNTDENNTHNQTRDENDQSSISSQQGDNNSMYEARASDPLFEYIGSGYEASRYSLGLNASDSDLSLTIVITINTSKPTTSKGEETTEKYRNEALQQIRNWGFNPNDYKVHVQYKY